MPLDVPGRTRATLNESACAPWPRGPGDPLKLLRAGNKLVQYNARNFAAVKFVAKTSQWRKIRTRRRKKKGGERNTCPVCHSQPIQSGKVSGPALSRPRRPGAGQEPLSTVVVVAAATSGETADRDLRGTEGVVSIRFKKYPADSPVIRVEPVTFLILSRCP
ncbi:hypothetical protein EVAR_29945_1 [Eumeta japonica]|uniref:Uncharacterized protein n=1 Tax=Eumeta variegata TaxID=151549 RepID=A0A4C1VIL9_EUMVA|nr:hypothetical protein EVAR_29945_1 [Eumeta japonica]